MTFFAILDRLSPRCTGPYSLAPAVGAGAGGLLASGAAATGGSGTGRAAGATGAAATAGGGAGLTVAGSTSTVYSRMSRPEDEVISTSKSINGSLTGRLEVILT